MDVLCGVVWCGVVCYDEVCYLLRGTFTIASLLDHHSQNHTLRTTTITFTHKHDPSNTHEHTPHIPFLSSGHHQEDGGSEGAVHSRPGRDGAGIRGIIVILIRFSSPRLCCAPFSHCSFSALSRPLSATLPPLFCFSSHSPTPPSPPIGAAGAIEGGIGHSVQCRIQHQGAFITSLNSICVS
jgi:hypothetical protein